MSSLEPELSQYLELLRRRRCLYSHHIDDSSGPRRSTLQIANLKSDRASLWSTWIRQVEEHSTFETNTRTERDSNYAHLGWPTTAQMKPPLWVQSRIGRCPQPLRPGPWITKNIAIRRLVVDIPLDGVSPVSDFVADVQIALGRWTEYERFVALKEVFGKWGDVLPLGYDIGTSASLTGPADIIKLLDESQGFRLGGISAFPTVQMCMQGGSTDTAHDDLMAWLSLPAPPERWVQIKVTRVVPITALLPAIMQSEVESLYTRLISYRPELKDLGLSVDQRIDGQNHALKIISELVIHTNDILRSVLVRYSDGTHSHQYGDPHGKQHVFSIQQDEYIIEVAVWSISGCICGIQFATSKGRLSQCYGGSNGQPTIYNSSGGALVALSADIGNAEGFVKAIRRVQTIWRHDLIPPGATTEEVCSGYFGGAGGVSFSDRRFLHNSTTGHVSGFKIRSGSCVHRIQATYKGHENRKPFVSSSWPHGGAEGLEETFHLERGEYITAVSGRHDETKIIQLCFKTNRGRTSSKYGQTSGKIFQCKAPVNYDGKPMQLRYILGKSSKCLNGIMFVWAPVGY